MDPVRRRAAVLATIVAVPIAVAVALVSLWQFGVFSAAPTPTPTKPVPTVPVDMAAPPLASAAVGVCRSVVSKLPDTLLGAPRRHVSSGAEQNAAYGEPPVRFSCGVPALQLAPTDQVNLLSGVCWFGSAAPGATVWTTVDRLVPVSVVVPGAQDGSAQSVIPFSTAILSSDPALAKIPTGCAN